jgi:hypothetical protein
MGFQQREIDQTHRRMRSAIERRKVFPHGIGFFFYLHVDLNQGRGRYFAVQQTKRVQ